MWQDTKEETGQVGDLLHVAIPGAARSTPVLIPETGRAVEVIPRAGDSCSTLTSVHGHETT